MKVTVCFDNVKVVVPCGQGDMLIRDLATMAVHRYQKSVASGSQTRTPDKPGTTSTLMIKPSDSRADSKSSGPVCSSEGHTYEVDALTLARDGGILDWDDRVVDVLDDRELLIAHFQTKRPAPETDSVHSSPSLVRSNAVSTGTGQPTSGTMNIAPFTRVPFNGEHDRDVPTDFIQIGSSFDPVRNSSKLVDNRAENRTHSIDDILFPNSGQVKEIVRQLNFEPCKTDPDGSKSWTVTPTYALQAPPPPPQRMAKPEGSSNFGAERGEVLNQDGTSTGSLLTFRGFASGRTGRPAPPPPPLPHLHSKVSTSYTTVQRLDSQVQPTTSQGEERSSIHPGGLLAHVADTMCPTSLAGQPCIHHPPDATQSTMPDVKHPINTTVVEDSSTNGTSAFDQSSEYSILASVPPPLQLRYPPGSLLPNLPNTSGASLVSTTPNDPVYLTDSSTLSTVPEEEQETMGSTSDQSTPPQSLHTVVFKVPGDALSQGDQNSRSSDNTTPTLSSTLSNSMQRLSYSESDGSKAPSLREQSSDHCYSLDTSASTVYNTTAARMAPTSTALSPPAAIPSLVCGDQTAIDAINTSTTSTAVSSQPVSTQISKLPPPPPPPLQSTSTTTHSKLIMSGTIPRPTRKIKRRRGPRGPPPPPPPVPPFREGDLHSRSCSGSDSDELLMMEDAQDKRSQCEPTSSSKPTDCYDVNNQTGELAVTAAPFLPDHACGHRPEDTEVLERTLGASFDLKGLNQAEAVTAVKPCQETGSSVLGHKEVAPNSTTEPLLAHWATPTDFIPGYTPKELAEAEHSLQQLEASFLPKSHPERERQFSLDEERGLTMKPAPPKRSPLTMLTGFSILNTSNHVCPLESDATPAIRNADNEKRHASVDDALQSGDATAGSMGSHDDVDAVVDDFHSARSSDTAHDLDDDADGDDDDAGHESSSLTGDELIDEQQRRAEAAEDEVLHMTELLSKRRESEARRHLMMAEMEADMERDHRLRAAATAMALAAVTNLSPNRKARLHRYHSHGARCARHSKHPAPVALQNSSLTDRDPYGHYTSNTYREEDIAISITKTPAGLGFSLTTKPVRSSCVPRQSKSVSSGGEESLAICVKNILPGGAALKDGQLRLGDRLLQVDDQDVSDKTQAQIVSMLRVKPVGSVVKLLVRRQFPLDQTTVPRPVPVGVTCPGCLVHTPDYMPYGPVILNNAPRAHPLSYPQSQSQRHHHHHHHPHQQQHQQSRQRAQQHHRQQLMEELAQRTHAHYPVCHTLQATKLSSLTGTRFPDRRVYRCASPPLLQHTTQLLDDLPDVTNTTDYPPYPDVLIFRLDIPLVCKSTSGGLPSTAGSSSNATAGLIIETGSVPTSDGTTAVTSNAASSTVSRHMRLGVSVRETCSSRASKLAERLANQASGTDPAARLPLHLIDEHWARDLGADSVYGGVLVKGIIEGGAAHKDGRLRVGDELLEVNGVPLINASSPLGLLRSVLRQLTLSPTNTTDSNKPELDESSIRVSEASVRSAKELYSGTKTDAADKSGLEGSSSTVPTVELLTARQMRHRRSASGHTLASNSEFWTETSPGSTITTTTTTCQTSVLSPGHPGSNALSGNNSGANLLPLSDRTCDSGLADSSAVVPSHAVQIAADVHLHQRSLGEETSLLETESKSPEVGSISTPGKSTSDVIVTTPSISAALTGTAAPSNFVNKPT